MQFMNSSLELQFMNFSLEKLVENLSDNDFKHLPKEFCSKNLEPLRQEGAYSYEYMYSFKRFREKKILIKNIFTAL